MPIPPEGISEGQATKVWCVGDDISWIRKGPDGRLYAINPENGFFGALPEQQQFNPNALISTQKGTIFTNVARNFDDNTVWWESLDKNPPVNAEEWTGKKVNGPDFIAEGGKLAHPNSRFTASKANCPCLSEQSENLQGKPDLRFRIRRKKSKCACSSLLSGKRLNHGVFIGSILSSETTVEILCSRCCSP